MKNFDYITNYLPGQKAAKLSIKRPIDKDGAKGINGDDFANTAATSQKWRLRTPR